MSTMIQISDLIMKKLEIESNKTGKNISDLVEEILSNDLERNTPIIVNKYEDMAPYLEFDREEKDTTLDDIVGIAEENLNNNWI